MAEKTISEKLDHIISGLINFVDTRTNEINQLKSNVDTALSKLNTFADREYSYSHSPFVINSLESDYNAIIVDEGILEKYPDIASRSAVGIRAELKHGDVINIQGNIMFINGVETENENGYSFKGVNSEGGAEIVNVWYFESNILTLYQECNFDVSEIRIKQIRNSITLDPSYYIYADEIHTDSYALSVMPYSTKRFYSEGQETLNQLIADGVEYFESTATTMHQLVTSIGGNKGKPRLKEIYLPELSEIILNGGNSVTVSPFGLYNAKATSDTYSYLPTRVIIPKVTAIGGKLLNGYPSHTLISCRVFNCIENVEIPESLLYMGNNVCGNNKTLTLKCKNAIKIYDSWCAGYVGTFNMCKDWGASIDISVAAQNWKIKNYIDLFENKLRNMESETRNITIPSSILAQLDEAVITAVTAKGWTLGGA